MQFSVVQLFPSSHVWNDHAENGMTIQVFAEKGFRVKGHFFKKIRLLIIYIFSKRNQGRSFQT